MAPFFVRFRDDEMLPQDPAAVRLPPFVIVIATQSLAGRAICDVARAVVIDWTWTGLIPIFIAIGARS